MQCKRGFNGLGSLFMERCYLQTLFKKFTEKNMKPHIIERKIFEVMCTENECIYFDLRECNRCKEYANVYSCEEVVKK